MIEIYDVNHDTDSCMEVWQGLYQVIYPQFFGKYFDFSKLEDKETPAKCKRWYIKLRDDFEGKQIYPKFKMAGDCIFNFSEKKFDIFDKLINHSSEGKELLEKCVDHHHCFENFAFMPITGGMNNQKGSNRLDRPDIHSHEIEKYFCGEESKIFNNARKNRVALEWYLSLFNRNIYKYLETIYLIEEEEFWEKKFLPFAKVKINTENTAIKYMELALEFWEKRKMYLENVGII